MLQGFRAGIQAFLINRPVGVPAGVPIWVKGYRLSEAPSGSTVNPRTSTRTPKP